MVGPGGGLCLGDTGGVKPCDGCVQCFCPGTQNSLPPCCCIPIGQPGSCASQTGFGQQCHCAIPCACVGGPQDGSSRPECCCIPIGDPGSCANQTAPGQICNCSGTQNPNCCQTSPCYCEQGASVVISGNVSYIIRECCGIPGSPIFGFGDTQFPTTTLAVPAGCCGGVFSGASATSTGTQQRCVGTSPVNTQIGFTEVSLNTCSGVGSFKLFFGSASNHFPTGGQAGFTMSGGCTGGAGTGSFNSTSTCNGSPFNNFEISGNIQVNFNRCHQCGPSGAVSGRSKGGVFFPSPVPPSTPCVGCQQATAGLSIGTLQDAIALGL